MGSFLPPAEKTKPPGPTSKEPETGSFGDSGGGVGWTRSFASYRRQRSLLWLAPTTGPAKGSFSKDCGRGACRRSSGFTKTHGGRMKSVALNLLASPADAEDAVQEAFLKVYRGAARFRGGSSVATWLYRILVNTCYDLMRKGRRRPEAPAAGADRDGAGPRARPSAAPRDRGGAAPPDPRASARRFCCARSRASRTARPARSSRSTRTPRARCSSAPSAGSRSRLRASRRVPAGGGA